MCVCVFVWSSFIWLSTAGLYFPQGQAALLHERHNSSSCGDLKITSVYFFPGWAHVSSHHVHGSKKDRGHWKNCTGRVCEYLETTKCADRSLLPRARVMSIKSVTIFTSCSFNCCFVCVKYFTNVSSPRDLSSIFKGGEVQPKYSVTCIYSKERLVWVCWERKALCSLSADESSSS